MKRYDKLTEIEKGIDEIEEVEKFNPYHDAWGRFCSGNLMTSSMTVRTKDPKKQYLADKAIARLKQQQQSQPQQQTTATKPQTQQTQQSQQQTPKKRKTRSKVIQMMYQVKSGDKVTLTLDDFDEDALEYAVRHYSGAGTVVTLKNGKKYTGSVGGFQRRNIHIPTWWLFNGYESRAKDVAQVDLVRR